MTFYLEIPQMSILLPQMPTELMLSPPKLRYLILLNPKNLPLIYSCLSLFCPTPNPVPRKSSLFLQTHSYPYLNTRSKLLLVLFHRLDLSHVSRPELNIVGIHQGSRLFHMQTHPCTACGNAPACPSTNCSASLVPPELGDRNAVLIGGG